MDDEKLYEDEFCKKYHYTLEEVLAMSKEELVEKFVRKSVVCAANAIAMGLFDNYKEGTPVEKLPYNLQFLYSYIPFDVRPHVLKYLTKSLI